MGHVIARPLLIGRIAGHLMSSQLLIGRCHMTLLRLVRNITGIVLIVVISMMAMMVIRFGHIIRKIIHTFGKMMKRLLVIW